MSERFDDELERLLADKLDGDLTPDGEHRLGELLAADDRARREAEGLEKVDRLVRAWGVRAPKADWSAFRAGVMDAVRAQKARATERPRILRFPAWAPRWYAAMPLAAAAVLAIIVTLNRPPTRPAGRPVAQAAPQPVVQVAYHRPAAAVVAVAVVGTVRNDTADGAAARVSVTFHRSEDLDQAVAAREAEGLAAPSMAVATGSRAAAPVAARLPLFPL